MIADFDRLNSVHTFSRADNPETIVTDFWFLPADW